MRVLKGHVIEKDLSLLWKIYGGFIRIKTDKYNKIVHFDCSEKDNLIGGIVGMQAEQPIKTAKTCLTFQIFMT